MMTQIRKRNLFIFIVMPSFFDIVKYIAVWRTRFLLHCYTDKFQRGYFKFYDYNRKKDIYINGRKGYDYKIQVPNFIGRFSKFYTINREAYEIKKDKAFEEYQNAEKPDKNKEIKVKQEYYIKMGRLQGVAEGVQALINYGNTKYNIAQLSKIFKINKETLGKILDNDKSLESKQSKANAAPIPNL